MCAPAGSAGAVLALGCRLLGVAGRRMQFISASEAAWGVGVGVARGAPGRTSGQCGLAHRS